VIFLMHTTCSSQIVWRQRRPPMPSEAARCLNLTSVTVVQTCSSRPLPQRSRQENWDLPSTWSEETCLPAGCLPILTCRASSAPVAGASGLEIGTRVASRFASLSGNGLCPVVAASGLQSRMKLVSPFAALGGDGERRALSTPGSPGSPGRVARVACQRHCHGGRRHFAGDCTELQTKLQVADEAELFHAALPGAWG